MTAAGEKVNRRGSASLGRGDPTASKSFLDASSYPAYWSAVAPLAEESDLRSASLVWWKPEAFGRVFLYSGLARASGGAWVVPLTATKTSVDFVIVAYGLVVPITEEDRLEVIQSLELRGLDDPESLAQAERFYLAAIRVAGSKFTDGLEELERLRTLYQAEPWFEGVGGDITGTLASTPPERMHEIAEIFSFPIDLTYQPEPDIAQVDVPMLWVLAGSDTEAPHETTLSILRGRQAEGQAIDVVIFPNAEHGIIERQDGEPSLSGRHSPGYLELLSEWIQSRTLTGPYGVGEVYEHSIEGLR